MSQYTISGSKNCLNTTNSFNNVWNNCTVADDLSQLLTWLSPLDPGLRHSDIQERRVEGIGEWLMGTEEFRRWCAVGGTGQGGEAVLFGYGNPGVGKTFISSLVVDRLCDQTRGQNTAVTCFYFDFAARNEQTATSMLGSLLKQVISGMERVPEEISRALHEQKKVVSGRKPQLGDIVKMLQLITSSLRTIMVIDALDECMVVQRFRLFNSLKEILEKSSGARIFVTGRPHIRAEIERRLAGRVTSVPVGPARDDITGFLRVRLSEDETPDAMDESLEAEILEIIPRNMSEMFLLVSLNIESILQELTKYRRRERLRRLTDVQGLEGVYGATIERIKAQGGHKSRLGLGALMWISHAERPLTAEELCYALAIELGSTDFNPDNIPSIATLVGCCQGLMSVDKEASTVRLIHFTLKEYLSAHSNIFNCPHSAMAEVCLTYLNSQHIKVVSADHPEDIPDQPFLQYCSVYWGAHAKRKLSDYARSLALELLQEYDDHISVTFLMDHMDKDDCGLAEETSHRLNGLHCASFFGIVEVVAALIEMKGYSSSEGYYFGISPLSWAAQNGHEGVVRILLGREDVDPNEADECGRTPVSCAAGKGFEGVVKMLLWREEVAPDRASGSGRTPLSYAAAGGFEGVVKTLLGRQEVNPDRPDKNGLTPLSYAALSGCEEAVEMLLGRQEVNPDRPDDSGRTPLSHAAEGGFEGVVKTLLRQQEVNPDRPDDIGRTPLSYAAEGGFEGVIKTLLGRQEVNPDRPANNGHPPLTYATVGGSEEVVKMLLGREEVNPGRPSNNGRTPLSYASENGFEDIVKILLEREEVSPDSTDDWGRAPLLLAARGGFEDVVKILLGREEVNPDKPDWRGRTPVSYAAAGAYYYGAKRERAGMVEMLLGREEVDPDKPDSDGRTPFSYAAEGGFEGVVKILLAREEVNSDRPDNRGRTPLSYASEKGYEDVVKILVAREEVDPDEPDNDGRTPLSYASRKGFEDVVKILLA